MEVAGMIKFVSKKKIQYFQTPSRWFHLCVFHIFWKLNNLRHKKNKRYKVTLIKSFEDFKPS
jgi:hypothetical protein